MSLVANVQRRWARPFDRELCVVHASLVGLLRDTRGYTLLKHGERVYDEHTPNDVRAFFSHVLLIDLDEANSHPLCQRAAQLRLYVVAADRTRNRLVVVLGTDTLQPKIIAHRFAAAKRIAASVGGESAPKLHCILVHWTLDGDVTSSQHESLRKICNDVTFEVFSARELLIDPVVHSAQPRNIRVAQPRDYADALALVANYASLQRLSANDAVWRRLGAEPGTMIEYERTNARTGSSLVRRVGAWNGHDEVARARECARLLSAFD